MRKINQKMVAILIIITMIMPFIPFKAFAIDNKENYTTIQVHNATGVNNNTKIITFENGTAAGTGRIFFGFPASPFR